jgi:hypothetical protein
MSDWVVGASTRVDAVDLDIAAECGLDTITALAADVTPGGPIIERYPVLDFGCRKIYSC